jgi:methyl-accepting chemotaxis protein
MSISSQGASDIVFEPLDAPKKKKKSFLSSSLNPLITLPIAHRLILVFLIPTLVAAVASGLIGIQSAQLLDQESRFYQSLFQNYSSLTTGNDFLQLMNFKLGAVMDSASDQKQLKSDIDVIKSLGGRYDTLLNEYIKNGLLSSNPDQSSLFDTAGYPGQAAQQRLLANSALRTWQLYRNTQDQILRYLQSNNVNDAKTLEHTQGEITFSDALSALRQLIQFNGRLVTYVQGATDIQKRNVLITTGVAIILVILSIGIIGVLTYGTLVKRLRQLHEVAQAVKKGKTDTRAIVDGKDEITTVSSSMNTMLDTIVGLLEETRVQRDALVQAAERLFSDMRLANNGELDIKAAVNSDPIGMLGNAFNFTVGRFRRFLLRNYTAVKQLDGISQRNQEHAESFLANMRHLLHSIQSSQHPRASSLVGYSSPDLRSRSEQSLSQENAGESPLDLFTQVTKMRLYVQQTVRQDLELAGLHLSSQLERAYHLCCHIEAELQAHNGMMTSSNLQGLRSLEAQIKELRLDAQTFQKKTSENMKEIETKTSNLLTVVRLIEPTARSSALSTNQVQELTRLADKFAQEVMTLAQSLRRVTQDMQASLAPFRLEALENA